MLAAEVSDKLAKDVAGVCQELLPNGKREGNEWCAGSVDGEEGRSLKVRLTGTKKGTWADFADSGKSGDLLDLWAYCRNETIADAINSACEYLGVQRKQHYFDKPARSYTLPARPQNATIPVNAELDYITKERKLTIEAIEAYKIRSRAGEIIFPHFRDGKLIAIKYRKIDGDKSDKWRWEKGCEPCLFGWQAIPDDVREVVICEGHIDAPSWWMLGHPALSIPNGVNAMDWIELEYDRLDRFDRVFLAMDNDEAGRKAISAIVDRLGRERVQVIELPDPFKDANELIQLGMTASQVETLFKNARSLDPDELKKADYFSQAVRDIAAGKHRGSEGYKMPWAEAGASFIFRPGEVTLLVGVNFSGKSEACGQISLELMSQSVKTCVASLEYKPATWISKLCRQASCTPLDKISEPYLDRTLDMVNENLWAFTAFGKSKFSLILEIFRYARRKYGVWLFLIDNLQKLGFADDDYNSQVDVINALTDFAKEHDCHVIMVHHMNKSVSNDLRGSSGVKGSGALTDLADNVIEWWRNREKEDKLQDLERMIIEPEEDLLNQPDAICKVQKSKNGEGSPPKYHLYFHQESHQFIWTRWSKPKKYVQFSTAENEVTA